jgi:hypothetical protein
MTFTEVQNVAAVLLSPVIAVGVTLWHQGRAERRQRKERLFMTLMGHRRASPPTHDWVTALNLIDVVFADCPKVTAHWHEYYKMLGTATNSNEYKNRDHTYLQLLTEMARVLGYKRLEQIDIDKFYSPVAHANQQELAFGIQQELLRVLKSSENFGIQYVEEASGPTETLAEPDKAA